MKNILNMLFVHGDGRRKSRRRVVFGVMSHAVLAASLVLSTAPTFAQRVSVDCGSLNNAFGPYDYTNPSHTVHNGPNMNESYLHIVERAHFTPEVENLIRGSGARYRPLEDLEYTLRAFPNHHRALYSMAKYHLRNGLKPLGLYTMDCWFERAIRFRPDDAVVRVVYGIFLVKKGSDDEALAQYKEALRLREELPEAHYNIGLLYTDLNRFELAYEHAIRAYQLGYPLPGLRNRLIRAGVWKTDEKK